MKFAEHLSAHITPEWRKQYINYEEMKALLYAAVEQAPSADISEPYVLDSFYSKFDEKFFHYCDKELTKINTFYSEKLAEATRRFATLNNELSEILSVSENAQSRKARYRSHILHKKPVSARKLQELKLAFSEFYLFLILLQNYQDLNFTGFRKILKKHDKLLNVDFGGKWRAEHVDTAIFHTHKDIDRLIAETEAVVTRDLEHGDRQRAMKRLRVPPLGEQLSPWITFKVGLFSGAFIILFIAVILSAMRYKKKDNWTVLCRIYRGPLLMIEFLFLMGINVYGWRSSGVNHVLIFELDPRNHLSEQHIIEMATILGLVWSMSILGFLYSDTLGIPPFVQPMLFYALLALFLFNPTKTLRHEARFWTLRVLGRVFCAPFFYVGFADFWLADQLNSLHTVFLDFQYFVCFYIQNSSWTDVTDTDTCIMRELSMRPFVVCLPAWFRFAQCLRRYRDTKETFPHLLNAVKYATSFFVVIFAYLHLTHKKYYALSTENPYFYLWLTVSVVSSCFTYTWDVKLDWGLFDSSAGENKFLREEIVYSSPYYYYFAMVEDFILRFGWAFSLSLTEMGYIHADLMVSIVAPLEVFRRFVWNFFRLENEHLNNCGKFRAVRDISVAPVDCSDQTQILRMMDASDGVINRRRKQNIEEKRKPIRLLVTDESLLDDN
ncbi:PREDICTED: xenotropic and polytropic retrovirus receptor 1 isoform X1 [Trachymyrmex septentrionalis]|uniref:xenotropic and polytropic retrovirus receptor 1 isoform X1 n=1 Tax=Trachymyrmex septentrionalis TaxID=34720 RepID=UPI00084F82DA|nr:PREDICTED: xenotropic and polytropic retrovirus receptor 1 isoform X1 [Trachymyrmex septentrionalis]